MNAFSHGEFHLMQYLQKGLPTSSSFPFVESFSPRYDVLLYKEVISVAVQ
jgi:hypothetical protein